MTAESSQEEIDAPETESVPQELLHGAPVVGEGTDRTLFAGREGVLDLVRALRADGFYQCIDLCAVDYLTHPCRPALPAGIEPERFEVVVHLINHSDRTRIRIRVQVPAEDATMPTLFPVHPTVEAMEREAFDLMGIHFVGHPDMSRILMPDDWNGHPLRKDYEVGRIPVQFKSVPGAR